MDGAYHGQGKPTPVLEVPEDLAGEKRGEAQGAEDDDEGRVACSSEENGIFKRYLSPKDVAYSRKLLSMWSWDTTSDRSHAETHAAG